MTLVGGAASRGVSEMFWRGGGGASSNFGAARSMRSITKYAKMASLKNLAVCYGAKQSAPPKSQLTNHSSL